LSFFRCVFSIFAPLSVAFCFLSCGPSILFSFFQFLEPSTFSPFQGFASKGAPFPPFYCHFQLSDSHADRIKVKYLSRSFFCHLLFYYVKVPPTHLHDSLSVRLPPPPFYPFLRYTHYTSLFPALVQGRPRIPPLGPWLLNPPPALSPLNPPSFFLSFCFSFFHLAHAKRLRRMSFSFFFFFFFRGFSFICFLSTRRRDSRFIERSLRPYFFYLFMYPLSLAWTPLLAR